MQATMQWETREVSGGNTGILSSKLRLQSLFAFVIKCEETEADWLVCRDVSSCQASLMTAQEQPLLEATEYH